MVNTVDVVQRCIGNIGKWQLRTILVIFLCKIPTSWFMAVIIYTAPAPVPGEYWCRPPGGFEPNSTTNWIMAAHPLVQRPHSRAFHRDVCNVYKDVMDEPHNYAQFLERAERTNDSNSDYRIVVPCENFVFRSDYHSLVAQFNLICSRSLLLSFSQCFHILGLLLGGIVAYFMLKRVSPRRVMLSGMLAQIVCGNAAGLVGTYELHVLFRCLSAMTCAFMYTSGSMILADITNGRAKVITTVVFELFWSIGLIMLPALTIFCNSYSQLYIAISMPTMVMVLLYRLIPDSPRWFLRLGHLDKAKEIITEGARANKIALPHNLDDLLKAQAAAVQTEPAQAKWSELWDGNPRRRHLFCVHSAWAIYILLFNSMVLNISSYGPEYIQMNNVAMGFSEMVGVSIGMYLILYTRRRWLWTGIFNITVGVLAYLTWFIPNNLKLHHIVALEMIPSILIKIATSSTLSILTACTVDLVAAEKKKTLMFSSAVWARAWFLWVPFIGMAKVYGPTVPLWIFATLAVIGGILTSIINHSHHRNHKKQTAAVDDEKIGAPPMQHVATIEMDMRGSIRMGEKGLTS